jgi:hypothetical protein
MKICSLLLLLAFAQAVPLHAAPPKKANQVSIAPAPAEEPLSDKFKLSVEGQAVPVYHTKVVGADRVAAAKADQERPGSSEATEEASFAYFDLRGSAEVTVQCQGKVEKAKILPSSLNIKPVVSGSNVSFKLNGPAQVTVEVNGDEIKSLHLFANPWDENPPKEGDPGVTYFGPGIHEVDNVQVTSGTVYIAPGAIIRGKPDPQVADGAVFMISGTNVVLRGRGIIDGSLCPRHSRHLIKVNAANHVRVEGVILTDCSKWNMPINASDHIDIENVKIFGWRGNTDGIDICNCRDVKVRGCFLRTWDDLVVVKTNRKGGPSERILVEKCTLWNELAHALSIGAELRDTVDDVRFQDCDVIHDKGREWTLRVFQCDAARIHDIVFSNIRVEESPRLISLWIGSSVWGRDKERGHIDGVRFESIAVASGSPATISLDGFDSTHLVEDTVFSNVTIDGQALKPEQILENAFVRRTVVKP